MKVYNATILAVLAFCLVTIPVSAKGDAKEIRGEVIEFKQGVPLDTRREFDRVTLRMRDGTTRRLLLGQNNGCQDCVAVGDQVRARVVQGDSQAEPGRVQTMKVRRTGEKLEFRNESGELLRTTTRTRGRARVDSGAGDGTRSRLQSETQGTVGGNHGHQRGGSGGGGRQR